MWKLIKRWFIVFPENVLSGVAMETTLNGTEDLIVNHFVMHRGLVINYYHLIYNLQTPSSTNCIQTRHMPIHLSGMPGN